MATTYKLDQLHSGETRRLEIPITDAETGVAIPLASVDTITLTLKNRRGVIINGRDSQNIKNANNGVYTDGELVWDVRTADTTIVGGRRRDTHTARIVITLSDAHKHYIIITIPLQAT